MVPFLLVTHPLNQVESQLHDERREVPAREFEATDFEGINRYADDED